MSLGTVPPHVNDINKHVLIALKRASKLDISCYATLQDACIPVKQMTK